MLKTNFSYINEFNQETTLVKTFEVQTLNDISEIELLVDVFKDFLRSAGFGTKIVNKIIIDEWEEELK